MRTLISTLMAVLALPVFASAQVPAAALSASVKQIFRFDEIYVLKSAERMPEDKYSFRPTPDVRTFGQILGHIVDSHYQICGGAIGDKVASDAEKTTTSKAGLLAALKDSIVYCQRAVDRAEAMPATDLVDGPGGKHPRIGMLYFNIAHTFEHYGNLVTYLRMNGIVPPSTDPKAGSAGAVR